jgi:hypothetical protein
MREDIPHQAVQVADKAGGPVCLACGHGAHTTSFNTNGVKGRIFCVGDRYTHYSASGIGTHTRKGTHHCSLQRGHIPVTKGDTFCVGDRLKGVKHSSWSTTLVARQ